MALPFGAANKRYPDRPLVEEVPAQRPVKAPQRFVSPQAFKVPRSYRIITLPAPVAGADYATIIVPPQTAWDWVGFNGTNQAGAAVVNRQFAVLIDDGLGGLGSFTGAIGAIFTANNQITFLGVKGIARSTGAVSQGSGEFTSILSIPLMPPIPAGYRISFPTAGLQPADQWTIGRFGVVEYKFPRGLAAGEIPIGLESGFMWDLADVRKVAED